MHKEKRSFLQDILFLLRATQLKWKWLIIGMLFIAFVGSFVEIITLSILYPFMILLLRGSDLTEYPSFIVDILRFVSLDQVGYRQMVFWMGSTILFISVARGIFSYFSKIYMRKKALTIENSLRNRLFEMYLYAAFYESNKKNAVDIISIITNDPRAFGGLLLGYIETASTSLIIIGIVAFLAIVNPYIVLLMVFFIGVIFLLYQLVKTKAAAHGRRVIEVNRDSLQYLHQGVWNLPVAKIRGAEPYFLSHFLRLNAESIQRILGLERLSIAPRAIMEAMIMISLVVFIMLYIFLGGDPASLFSIAGTLVIAIFRLLPMVMSISGFVQTVAGAKAAIHRPSEFIRHLGEPAYHSNGSVLEEKLQFSHLQLQDICFSYDGINKVLSHLNLQIRKGEFLGIVGQSGSGKTTLVHILLGLYSSSQGQMLINGQPSNELLARWQKTIGYVPQSIFLLEGSIKKNIAFGLHEKEIDRDLLNRAIRMAQLDEFVQSLPKGVETPLSESGKTISGGQRQRIGIARALYHEPEVLIFDEATNSLDEETEKGVLGDVRKLVTQEGITIVMIAHFQRALQVCDRIVRMKNGILEE